MLTLLELLQRTTEFFTKRGVPSPRLDAELIIAHELKCKRLELYLKFEKPVDEAVLEKLRPLVKRRGDREPLQYVLGDVEWGGLKLKTDRRALVPRQETEELWEKIVEEWKARSPKTILDLGTGTGALALALKKSFPEARVTAVERDIDTMTLAKENAAANGLEINFLQGSWFENIPSAKMFDIIVSNPPYLTDAEWESAQTEVKAWEPRGALTAIDEGFADIAQIIRAALDFLTPGGELWLEMGIAHGERIRELAERLAYVEVSIYKDHYQRERFARLKMG